MFTQDEQGLFSQACAPGTPTLPASDLRCSWPVATGKARKRAPLVRINSRLLGTALPVSPYRSHFRPSPARARFAILRKTLTQMEISGTGEFAGPCDHYRVTESSLATASFCPCFAKIGPEASSKIFRSCLTEVSYRKLCAR